MLLRHCCWYGWGFTLTICEIASLKVTIYLFFKLRVTILPEEEVVGHMNRLIYNFTTVFFMYLSSD